MTALAAHGQGPVFLQNGGQWPDAVQYRALVPSGAVFVEQAALTWHFWEGSPAHGHAHEQQQQANAAVGLRPKAEPETGHAHEPGVPLMPGLNTAPEPSDADHTPAPVRAHAYRMHWEGLAGPLQFRPEARLPGRTNILHGNDPTKWGQNLDSYGRLRASYSPGVELVLHGGAGDLKYDFVVSPGASVKELGMRWEAHDALHLEGGKLVLQTSINQVVEAAPYAYQEGPDGRETVPCRYRLKGNRVQFDFPEGYDHQRVLVIDPVTWVFGSYSGSTSDNWGYTATYDADGNLYGGGIVFGGGYPVTLGAYQTTWAGGSGGIGCDVGITKFSADGSTNIWSTYLGGANNELPHSLVVNDAGELWIYGSTGSTDFPVSAGAYDVNFAAGTNETVTGVAFLLGSDIFLSRLSADGSTLLASTYVGGTNNDGLNTGATEFNYGDHARGEVILDDAGRPVVASCTRSGDFPTTAGAFQGSYGGGLQDAVVFRLDADLSTLEWSTYLGGSGDEGAYAVKVQSSGNIVSCGGTSSTNFPTTPGVLLPGAPGGASDGWVARLSGDGSSLLASTYIGSPQSDQVYFVALDQDDDVYITGQTRSASFPVTPGVYSVPGAYQFVAKLQDAFNAFQYSSTFGSGGGEIDISPTAFLVDQCENVYVSGWGGLTNVVGNTNGLPVTPDAFQSTTDGSDFYFTVFEADMTSLLFATFYGGPISREHVDGGTSRFDEQGAIYQAVCAGCGSNDDFPTTPGAVSNMNASSNCNLGVAKIALDFTGVFADAGVLADTIGCAPFAAVFSNGSSSGATYAWDFGDGGTSTAFEPTYVYASPGSYTITLIATDPASCNGADTATLSLTVVTDSTEAGFDLSVEDFCDSVVISTTNTSQTVGSASYAWSFGDGTVSSLPNPTHTYTVPGTYSIVLIVSDPVSCNGGDTVFSSITVSSRAIAAVTGGAGCAPLDLTPVNGSVGISPAYSWDFGDGTTATGATASHTYSTPGTYTLSLIMVDPASCNNGDTATAEVTVFPVPIVGIDANPSSGSYFQDIVFSAPGEGDSWTWDFGDGTVGIGQSLEHAFAEPGDYTVCVTGSTDAGCSDTACLVIRLDADSELQFPTAFSPNADGSNDVFLPFDWGLEDYLLRIYNRWGEVVFESTDPRIGWDGRYRGEPQEVGTYKVTASGLGLDGVRYQTVSDLTLVR